jgi:PleD family two-component response regulator
MGTTKDSSPIKLLIAEDFHPETEALLRELTDVDFNFLYVVVQDETGFEKQLYKFKPDVILCPYSLPTTNAVKLLGVARKNGVNAPLILLVYDLSEDIAIDLLGEGIEDYILRSTIKRLAVAIRKALQRKKTELKLVRR